MSLDHTPESAEHSTFRDMSPDESTLLGFGFAWELGYMIALPAVLFGVGGAALDKYMHTSPLFVLVGLITAFITSAISVTRRIRDIIGRLPKVGPKKPEKHAPLVKETEEFHEQFRPRS